MNSTGAVPDLKRARALALGIGAVALAACLAGAMADYAQFLHSYLLAFLLWAGVALGCCALVMLHHLTGGEWGYVIRRLLESGMRTIPFLAVFILPVLVSLPTLYVWARPEVMAADEILQAKSAYLNQPFFLARTAFYFLVWMTLAWFLSKWSGMQDTSDDPAWSRKLRALSAPGILLYALTVTFASVDWAMSLEPHFFSTIYGVMFMIGQALSAMAFVLLVSGFLNRQGPLARMTTKPRLNDLGNLMLAFVMLWAYISFSQFLIVWSGNLPEEITWYTHRLKGGWAVVALLLVVFHFAVPFLLLLVRDVKRRARRLQVLCGLLLAMRLLDLFWVVTPTHGTEGLHVHWMDAAAPVGLGGVWVAIFLWQLQKRPLLPAQDPELKEILQHERSSAPA
ncbi:MAG: hypothetical protein FJW35_13450 [Acidobacteria bacterium]|nr:hypothetical protein [Acidobacteriota bacterium]